MAAMPHRVARAQLTSLPAIPPSLGQRSLRSNRETIVHLALPGETLVRSRVAARIRLYPLP